MKTETVNNNELEQIYSSYTPDVALSVAIGYEVANLLNLSADKKTGYIKTAWGTKSIKGLGQCIQRIIEEQTNRLNEK